MKRNILLGVVTALILAVSASGLLFGEQKKPRDRDWEPIKPEPPAMVLICHRSSDSSVGSVISVSEAAVAAHLAHGDNLVGLKAKPGDSCTIKQGLMPLK